MQGVRGGRRDARIAARRREPFGRDRRRIVAVNEIVRDARMVGMLGELPLEDVGRGQIGPVALVGQRLGAGEIERVEDLGLVVGRVARGQRLERAGPVELSRALGTVRPIVPVGGHGLDVVALALGLGADLPALIDRRLRSLGPLRRGADAGQGVGHQDGGDSPRRDRAGRILHQDVAECFLGLRVPERVQHRDRPLEALLHGGATRILEVDFAQLILGLGVSEIGDAERERNHQDRDRAEPLHRVPPLHRDHRRSEARAAPWAKARNLAHMTVGC